MLWQKSPVKLSPLIAGMLDGASHPISPNPITFRSVLSQSLSKHVNFPPFACATTRGFLALISGLRKPELRQALPEEVTGECEEREELPKPRTVTADEEAAAIFRVGVLGGERS